VKYKFPTITHIDDVKPLIENVQGFAINERDYGWVITYMQLGSEMFPDIDETSAGSGHIIRRECRGIAFDKNGKVISRSLHKFFNVNERNETHISNIDLASPHVILEKMDGSMIRPIQINDGYRLGTKAGVTDISMQAEVFVAEHNNYHQFIIDMISSGITPIFEWCSRQQRIVIDYPVDRLVLLAARHLYTGEYVSYNQLVDWGKSYNLDVVRTYPGSVESMQSLLVETKDLKDQEGWIIRWDDGHMVKIKADEYISIHRAKENIIREKNIIELFITEKIDDVKPYLQEHDRKNIDAFQSAFWNGLNATVSAWHDDYVKMRDKYGNDRKSFALECAPSLDPTKRSAMFWAWSKNSNQFMDFILDFISKNIGTQTDVNRVRSLWGGYTWNLSTIVDE
jgi:RNA ligase